MINFITLIKNIPDQEYKPYYLILWPVFQNKLIRSIKCNVSVAAKVIRFSPIWLQIVNYKKDIVSIDIETPIF